MEKKISLTALTIEQLAIILHKMGSKEATTANIRRDIADGAPTNEDGTISVIDYVAWFIQDGAKNDKPE